MKVSQKQRIMLLIMILTLLFGILFFFYQSFYYRMMYEEAIKQGAERLISHGAEILIAGCTEVSIILKPGDLQIPILDPVTILAKACIIELMNNR